jgi:hypothetical protein
MATKPTDVFTWATDANFASGPASGNPTKVNPTGWPTVLKGFIPGVAIVAEFMNKALNVCGQWTQWGNAGSSTGAADAHVVETDAGGNSAVQGFRVNAELVLAALLSIDDDGIQTIAAFGADQNNLAIATDVTVVRVSASTSGIDLTGIVAPGNAGQLLLLMNVGTAENIGITHDSGASTAANRILCAGGSSKTLNFGGCALLFYDGTSTRWRLLSCT